MRKYNYLRVGSATCLLVILCLDDDPYCPKRVWRSMKELFQNNYIFCDGISAHASVNRLVTSENRKSFLHCIIRSLKKKKMEG